MPSKKIVQKDNDDVLYKKAEKITSSEFGTKQLESMIQDMFDSLANEKNGVALAAPQIGISRRIFVISPKVSELIDKEVKSLIYINPEIIKTSVKKITMDEGCLSVAGWFGKIKRFDKVTIRAQDITGKTFTRGAGGLLSEIFQHETDHLEGILFTDKATDLRYIESNQDES